MKDALISWLNSSTAITTQFTALLGSLVAFLGVCAQLWKAVRGPRQAQEPHPPTPKTPSRRSRPTQKPLAPWRKVFTLRNPWLVVSMTLFVVGASMRLGRYAMAKEAPPDPRGVNAAWKDIETQNWSDAYTKASGCVDKFGAQAAEDQLELEQTHVPAPPIGSVQPDQREAVLARGVVNDVGACWYIKGYSAEMLLRTSEARAAYSACEKLSHARVYDPSDSSFWAPARTAASRLKRLSQP